MSECKTEAEAPDVASGCCGGAVVAEPSESATAPCCGTAEQARASGGCCGAEAEAEAVASRVGCCS